MDKGTQGKKKKNRKAEEEWKLPQLADAKLYAAHVPYNEPRNSTYYLHGDREKKMRWSSINKLSSKVDLDTIHPLSLSAQKPA